MKPNKQDIDAVYKLSTSRLEAYYEAIVGWRRNYPSKLAMQKELISTMKDSKISFKDLTDEVRKIWNTPGDTSHLESTTKISLLSLYENA